MTQLNGVTQVAPTYNDWQASLEGLSAKGRTIGLDIADLMHFGMTEYEESYSSLTELTGYTYSTVKSYVSVVTALPKSERVDLFNDPEGRITLAHVRAVQAIINADAKEVAIDLLRGFLAAWHNGGFWHDNPDDPSSVVTADAGFYAAVDTWKINNGLKKAGNKTKVAKVPGIFRDDVVKTIQALGADVIIPETILDAEQDQTFSLHIFAVIEEAE